MPARNESRHTCTVMIQMASAAADVAGWATSLPPVKVSRSSARLVGEFECDVGVPHALGAGVGQPITPHGRLYKEIAERSWMEVAGPPLAESHPL